MMRESIQRPWNRNRARSSTWRTVPIWIVCQVRVEEGVHPAALPARAHAREVDGLAHRAAAVRTLLGAVRHHRAHALVELRRAPQVGALRRHEGRVLAEHAELGRERDDPPGRAPACAVVRRGGLAGLGGLVDQLADAAVGPQPRDETLPAVGLRGDSNPASIVAGPAGRGAADHEPQRRRTVVARADQDLIVDEEVGQSRRQHCWSRWLASVPSLSSTVSTGSASTGPKSRR
jgi:hypothetical protein